MLLNDVDVVRREIEKASDDPRRSNKLKFDLMLAVLRQAAKTLLRYSSPHAKNLRHIVDATITAVEYPSSYPKAPTIRRQAHDEATRAADEAADLVYQRHIKDFPGIDGPLFAFVLQDAALAGAMAARPHIIAEATAPEQLIAPEWNAHPRNKIRVMGWGDFSNEMVRLHPTWDKDTPMTWEDFRKIRNSSGATVQHLVPYDKLRPED